MFFSIIMPIYNAERTLEKSLESIENQDYIDFEVLMINDGSCDKSEEICKKYAKNDSRFKYFKRDNHGVSSTRNFGIMHAGGEFIAFIDSDDLYAPDYLKEFRSMIKKYPGRDNYWCGFCVIRNSQKEDEMHVFSNTEIISVQKKQKVMNAHEKWLDSTLWNKVYRRTVIKDNNIRMNEDLSLGEDLIFNFDYLNATSSEIVILNQALYIYNQLEEGTLDSKYRSNLREIYEILDKKVLDYLIKWNVTKDQMEKFYSSVFYSQEKILRNTFHRDSVMATREKYRYNNSILKSEKFREAVKMSSCYIHPLYRLAYISRKYVIVQFIDRLVRLKKQIKERR